MKMTRVPLLTTVVIVTAFTMGCRHRTKATAREEPRVPVTVAVVGGAAANNPIPGIPLTIRTPPPLPITQPQENIPPRPSPAAIWIAGYYNFTGTSYAWKPGRWEIPSAGLSAWVPPSWQPSGNDYVYVPGHWQ